MMQLNLILKIVSNSGLWYLLSHATNSATVPEMYIMDDYVLKPAKYYFDIKRGLNTVIVEQIKVDNDEQLHKIVNELSPKWAVIDSGVEE